MPYNPNTLGKLAAGTMPINPGRPKAPPVQPKMPAAPKAPNQLGNGGGANNSGNNTGQKNKTNPDGTPSINSYLLGDSIYQNALNQLETNKKSAGQDYTTNLANTNQDYATTKTRIGQQQTQDNSNLIADYASRGLLGSGLNAQASNQLGQNYTNLVGDATLSNTRNKAALKSTSDQQNTLVDQQEHAARLDAIQRRAAEFGITTPAPKQKSNKKNNSGSGKKGKK
jgi:hypothetical protein